MFLEQDDFSNIGFHNYDNSGSTDVLGCMCPNATNFMETATLDDGSCVVYGGCSDSYALNYSGYLCDLAEFIDENCQYEEYVTGCYWCNLALNYFDFEYQITDNNMTILLPIFDDLVLGDVVGAFYVNQDGFIGCGGAVDFEGEQTSFAVWEDNPSTSEIDGFQAGDSFIFLVLRDGIVYETTTSLSNPNGPFTNTYGTNAFGQVSDLSITGEFIEECMLPLGVNQDCDGMAILENKGKNKQLIITIDLLGRNINNFNESGFYFMKYNDGTVEKKYFLNH